VIGLHKATLERIDGELAVEMGRLADHAKHRFVHGIGVSEVHAKQGGNATHAFDIDLEEALLRFFERAQIPARFSSEERPDVDLSTDPQLLVLVDPLDGSDVAARGYPLCSISVSIVDMETTTPLLSRIAEVFTGLQYAALGGSATLNGARMHPSGVTATRDAFVVSYFASSSRLAAFRQTGNWDEFRLVLNYGGMLDIAKVGSGQCDAMVEVLKGMVAREYIAGVHIAQTAGAIATTLSGDPIPVLLNRDARSKFVVAGTRQLHANVLALFG
jgi:fructose-1,6-bisphosphatase/inositol monophosphatase family enzyme